MACVLLVSGIAGLNSGASSRTTPTASVPPAAAPVHPQNALIARKKPLEGEEGVHDQITVIGTAPKKMTHFPRSTTAKPSPPATASPTTLEGADCRQLTPLEQADIDPERLPPLDANLTASDAVQFAVQYELTYAAAEIVPEDAGMSEPSATVNQTADGYLVRLSYIYGGTDVITVQPTLAPAAPATTGTEVVPVERTTRTEVIHWDAFPVVYYYVSPTRVLRTDGPSPPAQPRTDGKVIHCEM